MARTPPSKVSDLLVERLLDEHRQGRLTYHRHTRYRGPGTSIRYLFDTPAGQHRAFDTAGTWAWLRGWEAGHLAAGTPPRRPAPDLSTLRQILETPGLADQIRLQLRVAMEAHGVGIVELARLAGLTRKSVSDALRLSAAGSLSTSTAEAIFRALPGDWPRRQIIPYPAAGAQPTGVTPLRDAQPEPAGIARARAAVIAQDAGLLRYLGPVDPNKAIRASTFLFDVAGLGERKVLASVVIEWLTGVADGVGDQATADAITPPARRA